MVCVCTVCHYKNEVKYILCRGNYEWTSLLTVATNSLKPWAGLAYTRKQVENKNKNIQKYSFGQSQVIIFQIASLLFLLSHRTSSNPSLRQTTLSLPLSPYIWWEQVNSTRTVLSWMCVKTKLHHVMISQKRWICSMKRSHTSCVDGLL